MNYKKYLLSILFFFTFHSTIYSQLLKNFTSSFESNSAYYTDDSKTGDFSYNNRFRTNNYINLKSYLNKNWNFELQIESYQPSPLLNYSTNLKKTNISTFNISYDNNNLNIQLGNSYEQFGSGMILRSW